MFPEGYISNATAWRAPVWPPHNTNASEPCDPARQCGRAINLTLANTTDGDGFHGIFDNYTLGTGPGCSMYDPPRSPWCAGGFYVERMRGGGLGDLHARSPSGIDAPPLPHLPYHDARGARVFAWRPAHWYTWVFEVGKVIDTYTRNSQGGGEEEAAAAEQSLLFTAGGNQGGEGADFADEWYIENVREELDAPNEFWYDEERGQLGTLAAPIGARRLPTPRKSTQFHLFLHNSP